MNLIILLIFNALTAMLILWIFEWRHMTDSPYAKQTFFLSLPAWMISLLMSKSLNGFNIFELMIASLIEYVVVFCIFYAFGKLNE